MILALVFLFIMLISFGAICALFIWCILSLLEMVLRATYPEEMNKNFGHKIREINISPTHDWRDEL